jgi:hypothetical protein
MHIGDFCIGRSKSGVDYRSPHRVSASQRPDCVVFVCPGHPENGKQAVSDGRYDQP